MDVFLFQLEISGTVYHLQCDLWNKSSTKEVYRIHPQKSEAIYILLQNNRPLIRGKYKLKKKPYDWTQIEGEPWNPKALRDLIRVLQSWIEPSEKRKSSRNPTRLHYSNSDRKKDKGGSATLQERKKN